MDSWLLDGLNKLEKAFKPKYQMELLLFQVLIAPSPINFCTPTEVSTSQFWALLGTIRGQ